MDSETLQVESCLTFLLKFLLDLTFRCLELELHSFDTNQIALCWVKHLVNLIYKAITSHLYVKVNEFIILFPGGEFLWKDNKESSGREESEPFPRISWIPQHEPEGIWKTSQNVETRRGRFPYLPILLGVACILLPKTAILLAPRSYLLCYLSLLREEKI